jgi:hypothetical protein
MAYRRLAAKRPSPAQCCFRAQCCRAGGLPILQLNVVDPPLYLEFPVEGKAAKLESEIRALTGVAEPATPGENTWNDAPW